MKAVLVGFEKKLGNATMAVVLESGTPLAYSSLPRKFDSLVRVYPKPQWTMKPRAKKQKCGLGPCKMLSNQIPSFLLQCPAHWIPRAAHRRSVLGSVQISRERFPGRGPLLFPKDKFTTWIVVLSALGMWTRWTNAFLEHGSLILLCFFRSRGPLVSSQRHGTSRVARPLACSIWESCLVANPSLPDRVPVV